MKFIRRLVVIFIAIFSMFFCTITCKAATETYRINNSKLTFNEIVYVDITGNDNTGDGSEVKPFKTLWRALNYLCDNNLKENVAVIMGDGDYDWSAIASGYSYNINPKFNGMKVSFIAKNPGKASFYSNEGLEMLILEQNSSMRINFKFYGLIIHNIKGNREYTHLGGDSWGIEYYNCVFDNLKIGGWNSVDQNAFIKVQNCLFYNCTKNGSYYDAALKGEAINTASTNEVMDPYNGIKKSCLNKVSTNSKFEIVSDGWMNKGQGTNPDGTPANIGVYGGEFAWGDWRVNNDEAILYTEASEKNLSLNEEVCVNVIMNNVMGIVSEDITIKYDNKKLKFLGIEKVDGIRVIKMIKKEGELRVVLSKEDKEKLINNKQLLLKLNFQGISSGYAFVDIVKGKVSDGIKMNHSLTDKECGWTYMIIN